MEEKKETKETGGFYGHVLTMNITSAALAITTFLGFGYVGFSQFDGPERLIVGIVTGIMGYFSIDKALASIKKDLIHRQDNPVGLWAAFTIALVLTAGSTFFISKFVEGEIAAPVSTDHKQKVRGEILERHDKVISQTKQDVRQIEKDIRNLTRAFKRDTAKMIASWHPNHQELYRKGKHSRYTKRASYSTLKTNVDRLENRINQYLTDIGNKQTNLDQLQSGLIEMQTGNPLAIINKEFEEEDKSRKEKGAIVNIGIWVFDIALASGFLFAFFQVRNKKKFNPDLVVDFGDKDKWIVERWSNTMTRLLSNSNVADSSLQNLSISFFSLIGSLLDLLKLAFDLFSFLIRSPVIVAEKFTDKPTENKTAETSEKTVVKPDEKTVGKRVGEIANPTLFSTNEKRVEIKGFTTGGKTVGNRLENVDMLGTATTLQPQLPTMVGGVSTVGKTVGESKSIEEPKTVGKTVGENKQIKAKIPEKIQPISNPAKVVEIDIDGKGKKMAVIDRGDHVETIDFSTVSKRLSGWESKTPKTKKGKANKARWIAFWKDLKKQMKA